MKKSINSAKISFVIHVNATPVRSDFQITYFAVSEDYAVPQIMDLFLHTALPYQAWCAGIWTNYV